MNPRYSSYCKFLLRVLVTLLFSLASMLLASPVLAAPEVWFDVMLITSSSAVEGVFVNCSIVSQRIKW